MSAAAPPVPASLARGLALAVFLVVAATYVVNAMDRIVFPVLLPAGAAASMFGIGALTGVLCGYLADRVSQKAVSLCALVVLGAVGYALFNLAVTPLQQDALSFLEGSAFSGFLYVNNYSLMQRSVRAAMTGRASGLVVTCVYLPAALSGYIFAELRGAYGWGGAALLQMCLQLAVAFVAMLFFDPARTSARPAAAPTADAVVTP